VRITVRLLLAWFALFGLAVGAWQLLAPASFYANFPGLGHQWVNPDGPYNQHLLRDVGQGNAALGVVALVALLSGDVWLARATGLAAIVANLPHQLYHQTHVNLLPTTTDQVLQSVSLAAVSVAAILLTVLGFRLPAHHDITGPDAGSGRRTRSVN
jgi:TRAP-type C4-dicarboxylate transport system permease small subunit